MVLESGEEIFCGYATNIYKYLLGVYNIKYVPLSGNKQYVLIRNLYNSDKNQFVSYKAE